MSTVQVPYDYYLLCHAGNFNLSHVPVYIMGEDELALYSAYMATLGNREDLFPGLAMWTSISTTRPALPSG